MTLYLKVQLRHQSDLDNGKPSSTKPPFACMTPCNPKMPMLIDTGDDFPTVEIKQCSNDNIDKDNKCFDQMTSSNYN